MHIYGPWIVAALWSIVVLLFVIAGTLLLRGPGASLAISWKLNRDSAVWFWGKVLGTAGVIAGGGLVPLSDYGVPSEFIHVVTVISGVITLVSGIFGRSPLPGKPSVPPK